MEERPSEDPPAGTAPASGSFLPLTAQWAAVEEWAEASDESHEVLTFQRDGCWFGVLRSAVEIVEGEVAGAQAPPPGSWDFVDGTMDWRGERHPLLNLPRYLRLPPRQFAAPAGAVPRGDDPPGTVAWVTCSGTSVGLLVHQVGPLVAVNSRQVLGVMRVGIEAMCVVGVFQHGEREYIFLDPMYLATVAHSLFTSPPAPPRLVEDAVVGWGAGEAPGPRGRTVVAFRLGSRRYGLPVESVTEACMRPSIVPLPRVPAFVRGLIFRQGKMIPVVDLAALLGETLHRGEYVQVLVARIEDWDLGLLVGGDAEAVEYPLNAWWAPEAEGSRGSGGALAVSAAATCVSGVLMGRGDPVAVLDLKAVLALDSVRAFVKGDELP